MRHLYSRIWVLLVAFGYSVPGWSQQPNDHIFPAAAAARAFIDFDSRGFLINGQRTFLVSAGLEYARIPAALWADRLLRLQRCGFNCVEVYTFWNFHEPREGVFDFSGEHDLDAFLKLVRKMGMYAIVRVGPYYCAEWDNGGYPLWLRFKPGLRVREPNAVFEKEVGLFFDRLLPIVFSNQIHKGGSVIMVQLENEHPAGWGTDEPNEYFSFLRKKALALGLEVPYFFSGLHHASDPAGDAESLDDPGRPNPWFSTEFWSVWYNGYGSGEKEARLFERRTWKIIAHGGNGYNYYMAHGGSNFGYTNNDEDAASYDYGAAVGQGGDLRPIYYSYKKAAFFARSFEAVLENSTDATEAYRGMLKDTLVKVSARKGPAGTLIFLDNTSERDRKVVVGKNDTLTLAAGEIRPLVRDYLLTPDFRLTGHTGSILGIVKQGAVTTLLVYDKAGSRIKLHFSGSSSTFSVPGGQEPAQYWLTGKHSRLKVFVMKPELADRTWIIPAGSDGGHLGGESRRLGGDSSYIVCGPRYAGEMKDITLVTEEPVTAADKMQTRAALGAWLTRSATDAVNPGYDDKGWTKSDWPLQMGADGDTTADAWYRATVTTATAGDYTLLVDGADRATVFIDGQPVGRANMKKGGELNFPLSEGRHVLAVFTAHDGRDKLPAYLGPVDSADRKGLFGKALLVRGRHVISELSGWRMVKAKTAGDVEKDIPSAGWQPYVIGQDAFDKKEGYGWFQVELPVTPAGAQQARLHFASVDEDATVFINGHRVAKHEGWNAPFDVMIDRVDTMHQPVVLTVFVENHSNEGGIDQPVRIAELVSPVEVKGWRMRGGTGDTAGTWADSGHFEGPCWWKTEFRLPVNAGLRPVWRVIPRGLGHGSIWVNGHNLGRYPEKIPVDGLYIPECWLVPGSNSLLIFDEDGRAAGQVSVEAEVPASRRVGTVAVRRQADGEGNRRSDVLHWVDPFIGTAKSDAFTRWGNEGGTYPGAVAPSGYMQLTPETRRDPVRGYDFHDSLIYVFSCTHHSSGFPNGSAGRLYVMPLLGGEGVGGGLLRGRPFSHEEEKAEPGYYRVKLADDGTVVEAVATVRAGIYRITFPGGVEPAIFVGDTASAAFDFSEGYGTRKAVEGGEIFTFATTLGARSILVRISQTSAGSESARRNIDRECVGGFEQLRATVREQWRKALSVVEIDGDNKTIFYTALYHSLLVPWVISDVDGYYLGADQEKHRVVGRNEYGNFSSWDSYRSLHPLLTLLYPGLQSEMVQSMVDVYRQGGYLPVESMTGNHAVPIIVDAYRKGIRGIDRVEVYDAMLKSIVRGPFQQDDRTVYGEKGYIPSTHPESVTRTVEYGYDDWVLGQYAGKVMGDEKTAAMLVKRSMAWRQLLHIPSLLLLPRDGDSFRVRPGNLGYKEGDTWVYSYFAPQDAGGLIDRMGGDVYFCARLDSALTDGRIVFDNETVLHIPYFFNEAGRPDLTRKWVKKIMRERYKDQPGGLPGNDDLGAMSSWYVFSALGFFPFCPGKPVYSMGAPMFKKVVLHLEGGKRFVVRREEGSGGWLLNGRPFDLTELSHAAIVAGGELVFREGGVLRVEKRNKPLFEMSGVKLAAGQVRPGEENRIYFSLQNKGVTGVKRVLLQAGGKAVGSVNCLVGAGQKVRDSITFKLYQRGAVKIDIGGIDAGTVQVVPPSGSLPAEPEVKGIDMRVMMREGDKQVVSYTVQNTGWERQVFRLPVRVDGEVIGIDSVGLDAGEESVRSMDYTSGKAGWHELRIGGREQRFKVYREAAEAVVLDLDSTLQDRSGFGNNGIKVGKGVRLGQDGYIRIPGSPSLGDMGEKLTMLLWVYPEGKGDGGLVDIFTNGDNHVLQVAGGRQLTFFAGGWGRGDNTVNLPKDWSGHWHLIAGVCDRDGLRVYIDGEQRGFTPLEKSVHLLAGDNTWMIGRNEEFPGQRIYEGYVRRPRIFQEALSAGAILTIYRQESNNQ